MNWKPLFALVILAVAAAGCNDPVTPRPDDAPDKDKNPPQTDYTWNAAPDPPSSSGFRLM